MSKPTNYTIGIFLLVLTATVVGAISLYGLPLLLQTPNEIVAETTVFEDSESPEAIAESPPATVTPQSTPEPTDLPIPTAVAEQSAESEVVEEVAEPVEPTEVVPTATSEPTATPEPTNTTEPTVVAKSEDSAETGVQSDRAFPQVFAIQDAALFIEEYGNGGRTGYYVPQAQWAWLVGRNQDGRWLHVRHQLDVEGWVSAAFMNLDDVDLESVTVSDYIGAPDPIALAAVTATPVPPPTATNRPQPTWTPWPTRTPWPTNTATPVWPTRTPTPWPTRTPVPTSPPQPTATWTIPTPEPTSRPPSGSPATPTPSGNGGAETNAVAWWFVEQGAIENNGSTWWAVVTVRVPTSFQYTFDMANLVSTELARRNDDGDDYFELKISGMQCGNGNYSAELIARQNGAKMQVFHEFDAKSGPVTITTPC